MRDIKWYQFWLWLPIIIWVFFSNIVDTLKRKK